MRRFCFFILALGFAVSRWGTAAELVCGPSAPLAAATGKGHIRGRVLLANGKPAAGVALMAEDVHGTHEDPWTRRLASVTSGPDGAFDLTPMDPGIYLFGVNVDFPGIGRPYYRKSYYPGVELRSAAARVTVGEGQDVNGLCFQLPPDLPDGTVPLTVILQRADGTPAPHTNIGVTNQLWLHRTEPAPAATDAQGKGMVQLRKTQHYWIWATVNSGHGRECAGPAEVIAKEPLAPVTLVLEERRGNCRPAVPTNER